MQITLRSMRRHYSARLSIFVIVAALIAGMAGCDWASPPEEREIWDWHDLHAVRRNPDDNYRLMNDLDATSAGYEELASPTANGGKGWEPIDTSTLSWGFEFDGQGHEIRDLFIHRPDELFVGLFGDVSAVVIQNVGLVNASVTGGRRVGGLVGESIKATVRNSYFRGNVTGSENVGGLVGGSLQSYVMDSYSTGNVSGGSIVGGLVADNAAGGTVSNSYSAGSVTGAEYVGGLVALSNGGDVINSFWDIETSGQTISAGGTGKTTTEMQDMATFIEAEWSMVAVANPDTRDPSYIWNIVNGTAYPFLSWQPTS